MEFFTQQSQYGGFVKNKSTGEYEPLFTTYMSDILAKNRAIEMAKAKNVHQEEQYDINDIIIKVRNVRTIYDNWKPIDSAS